MPNGYELIEEYKRSLLAYWEDGHGEMLVLVSELQGFLDCLTKLELIKQDDYMHIIDCFKKEAKKVRVFKDDFYRRQRVQFKDIKDRECFYSGGILYMRILQQDLEHYGIDCVNAISILNGGLTFFYADEKVYKAERTDKKERIKKLYQESTAKK